MRGGQSLTLALGFGRDTAPAQTAARAPRCQRASRDTRRVSGRLAPLSGEPQARPEERLGAGTLYNASVMTLAAHEDKTYRGGYMVAYDALDLGRPTKIENPSGPYHLVWSRDLYQIATALNAAGDTAGANRAVDYLFLRQQKPDGWFPQNSTVDGTPHWSNLQLDEVALPIVLAWQLGPGTTGLYRTTSRRPRTSSSTSLTPPSPRKSAGRTRADTHPARSPPRSRASCAPRTSPEGTGHGLRACTRRPRMSGRARRQLDRHDQRPVFAKTLLPRLTKDGNPNLRDALQHRRQRTDGRPAQGRRPELPRARQARREARQRPAASRP